MRLLSFVKNTLFSGTLFFACVAARADVLLNGIASHQELGQEQFIGALFSESVSNDPERLLAVNQPMRIELKILTAEGLSARRFSRMWIDGMAINNNSDILTSQADNIVKLDSFFKGRLLTGDHVVFRLVPGQGVDALMNGVLLGNIKDDKFFALMLSTWIGKVPLSTDFKIHVLTLGSSGDDLKARFDQIKFSPDRAVEVMEWSGQPQVVVASKSSVKSPVTNVSVIAIEKPKPEIALPSLANEKEFATSSARKQQSKSTTQSSSKSKKVVEEDDDDSAPAFTAESLLARQLYIKEVSKSIFKKVRYPSSAQQKGQEGNIRLAVTLDRNGNVMGIIIVSSSPHSSLNREAQAAINRAAPFPAIPDSIPGDRFEFNVPIRFTIVGKPK